MARSSRTAQALWRAGGSEHVTAMSVVFFPYAGGSASAARALTPAISPGQTLWAAQYPGRGPRYGERLAGCVEELAEQCAAEISQLPVPVLLCGHSFGAFVAFEVARRLLDTGRPPVGIVVSASPAPGAPATIETATLTDDELALLLVRRGGTPPELLENRELMELALPAIRADFALADAYRVELAPPLDLPLAAVGGAADETVPATALEEWQTVTTGWLGATVVPGGHFYYLDDVTVLANVFAHPGFQLEVSR